MLGVRIRGLAESAENVDRPCAEMGGGGGGSPRAVEEPGPEGGSPLVEGLGVTETELVVEVVAGGGGGSGRDMECYGSL